MKDIKSRFEKPEEPPNLTEAHHSKAETNPRRSRRKQTQRLQQSDRWLCNKTMPSGTQRLVSLTCWEERTANLESQTL